MQPQPFEEPRWDQDPAPAEPEATMFVADEDSESTGPRRSLASILIAIVLTLAALGWIGVYGYATWQAWPGNSLAAWTAWTATASAPLALLALVWMIFGRTSRRETARFIKAVTAMQRESEALDNQLSIVANRLEENRAALTDEAARLMTLGDEASDRLGRVTHYLARESADLERRAQALDNAAATARIDIGALLSDLPQAEQAARNAAESLKAAGLRAHEQAASLEGQLAALGARGREADEAAGGAAQRLGAQIARIETTTGAAVVAIDQAAVQMNSAVDSALARASQSVEQARMGLDSQGQAMLAMIEQSRAAFVSAGAESAQALMARVDEAGAKVEALAGQLGRQEAVTQNLLAGMATKLAELDAQLATLGDSGETQHARLARSVSEVRESAEALHREIYQGETATTALSSRAEEMGQVLASLAAKLRDELPVALSEVQAQALQTGAAASAAVQPVEAIRDAATQAAAALAESEASVGRQREQLDSLLSRVETGVRDAETQLRALDETAVQSANSAARLTQESGPQLIDALVRVRETANQAAANAREAIAAIVPASAAALAEASRDALAAAVTEPVEDRLAELGAAAQRAMAVARQASERLTRQLLVMGETASAIEERIAEDKAEREEKAEENLSRRVSLLIEALNSTAIDVNKILSNEVADTAWAAYLKGDRGVFTRRAVRLLDSGEAREIQRHYEDEPDFREQVNRYVHDFETMLRRVLADRDGATLSVTLLSSDMGKLYVALAQAIDRLRR